MLHHLDATELHQPYIINCPDRSKGSAALEFFLAGSGRRNDHTLLAGKSRQIFSTLDHIGEALTEHSVKIALQHGGKATPPER